MKNSLLLLATAMLITLLSFTNNLKAQVKIGDNPASINSSSLLELESTDKGLLIPRMTTAQRDAIASPSTGLQLFNTTTNAFNYYNGSSWEELESQVRENYVLVKSAADLPTPSGGTITLAPGTVYEINGSISVSDKIDLNNNQSHWIF